MFDWLIIGWRLLRNLDQLEATARHQRITFRLATIGHEAVLAAELQLAACRALLAVAMRERDEAQAALELAERELHKINCVQRERREADRYWLTRTVTPQKVNEN